MKKIALMLVAVILVISMLPMKQQAQAATTYTFVNVTYKETEAKDGSVTKTLSKVTLENSAGKTASFNIDSKTTLYVNNTLTKIGSFKAGMPVTIKVNLNRISEMRGTSIDIEEGAIATNSKQYAGTVTQIDPNGMFVRIKLDNAGTKSYYLNDDTNYIKGSKAVDLSALYEGDRVKVRFSTANATVISQLDIVTTGVEIHNVYKANLVSINPSTNKMTVKNANPFDNWMFGSDTTTKQTTFTLTNTTTIYAGNKKITKNQLKNYRNNALYYVTTNQFGKEIVKKVVVLTKNERTFYQALRAVNTSYRFFNLTSAGRIDYHPGTILVRNGRLIEAESLASSGTAFVVTDGNTSTQYAHVVNVTNDSFTSPNLAKHQLYFGKISLADMDNYLVELSNKNKYDNNYWQTTKDGDVFAFSNSTTVIEQVGSAQIKVVPETELFLYENMDAYVYVKDGHVQAMHIIDPKDARTQLTLTGRVNEVKVNSIRVQSVSQWVNGEWKPYSTTTIDLTKSLIIKDGKAIQASQLKASDRVVLLMNSELETHIVFVN